MACGPVVVIPLSTKNCKDFHADSNVSHEVQGIPDGLPRGCTYKNKAQTGFVEKSKEEK